MRGDAAAVRAAVAEGSDVNGAQGDGMTALHWAASRGDVALATLLLRAKANVKATTRIGAYTPLHVASQGGSAPIVKALLASGADARAVTTDGVSALHLAAMGGDAAVVHALVAAGADVNASEPLWGQTPRWWPARAGARCRARPAWRGPRVRGNHRPMKLRTGPAGQEIVTRSCDLREKQGMADPHWQPDAPGAG
jgi:ankyrin repeat protein